MGLDLSLHWDYIIVSSGLFCENSLLGILLLCSVFNLRVSLRAFPACCDPCVSLFVYCCWRKPAGTEDTSKRTQESPRKSDSVEDCRWTVTLRHSSRVRSTNLVSELHRRTASEGIRGTKEGVFRRVAVSEWTQKLYRKVGADLSHSVLCASKDVFCMIDTYRGV